MNHIGGNHTQRPEHIVLSGTCHNRQSLAVPKIRQLVMCPVIFLLLLQIAKFNPCHKRCPKHRQDTGLLKMSVRI